MENDINSSIDPSTGTGEALNNAANDSDISTASQRVKILNYLQQNGSATVLEITEKLCILSPTARVSELRGQGHKIETIRITKSTHDGVEHNVAKYVLQSNIDGKEAPK